jgi:hypothetical protein
MLHKSTLAGFNQVLKFWSQVRDKDLGEYLDDAVYEGNWPEIFQVICAL